MEGCWLVKRDGTILSLKKNISGSSDYVPTYVPSCSDRAVTTRSTTATAERRQRNLPEQSFVFNLSNEVCMKYSIFTVADRGLRPWQWTSSRLQGEVMYLETRKSAALHLHNLCTLMHHRVCRERYEVSRQNGKSNAIMSEQKENAVSMAPFLTGMLRPMLSSCRSTIPGRNATGFSRNWQCIHWVCLFLPISRSYCMSISVGKTFRSHLRPCSDGWSSLFGSFIGLSVVGTNVRPSRWRPVQHRPSLLPLPFMKDWFLYSFEFGRQIFSNACFFTKS